MRGWGQVFFARAAAGDADLQRVSQASRGLALICARAHICAPVGEGAHDGDGAGESLISWAMIVSIAFHAVAVICYLG